MDAANKCLKQGQDGTIIGGQINKVIGMTANDYNPAYIFPGSLEDARRHRQANRIFKGDNYQADYDFHKCECCARSIGEEEVDPPFCYDPTQKLMFLGPGVPLLFIFTRVSTLLLLLMTLLFSVFALVTNMAADNCSSTQSNSSQVCSTSIFVRLSIANKIFDERSINIQNYLLVVFLLFYIGFLQLLIYTTRRTDQRSDQLINSPSDYAILISQLPEVWTVDDILDMITEQRIDMDEDLRAETDNLSIKDMIFSFKISDYLGLLEEDEEQFVKAKKEDPHCQYQHIQIPMPHQVSSFVIVIFNRQASKKVFREPRDCLYSIRNFLCNSTLCLTYSRFHVNEKAVVVERSPQPDDILWQNADKPRRYIIRTKVIVYVCSVAILALGGFIQYVLEVQKNNLDSDFLTNLFNVISSLSLTIFNGIISIFLVFMTAKEGDITQTNMNASLLIKVCLFEFFNSGVFNTFARILAEEVQNFNIHGDEAYEIFLFMALNAVVPNLATLFLTVTEFPNRIFRILHGRGCVSYNQKRLNEVYMKPEIEFPIKYAFVINTIWLTCFYCAFAPIIVPVSVLGLIIFHLTEQYLFGNKYSAPFMLSKDLTDTAISLLRYTGLITMSGSFIVTLFISTQLGAGFSATEAIPFILGLIVSLVLIFMPSSRINQYLFTVKDKQKAPPTYDQACRQFTVTYKETHPLSSHARKMKRGEVLVKNFFELVELKSTSYSTPVKYSHSMNWVEAQSSRQSPLILKKTMSVEV